VTAKRTSRDLWKALLAEAGEDEVERAAKVTVAQAEAQIRKAGFDPNRERSKAVAWLDELEGKAARPAAREADEPLSAGEPAAWVAGVRPSDGRSSSAARWALLLAAALTAAAGAIYALAHHAPPPDKPIEVPPVPAPSAQVAPAPTVPAPQAPPATHDLKP